MSVDYDPFNTSQFAKNSSFIEGAAYLYQEALPGERATMKCYGLETHAQATMKCYGPETHVQATMKCYGPD